ncbi:MAG: LysM peptidoglycan-binding domain-containing protein [Elusimicrobiales bacterium]|nr:LysM peptidoglycan-binding domain-containing protein [Elusimicrobiales bacterium]
MLPGLRRSAALAVLLLSPSFSPAAPRGALPRGERDFLSGRLDNAIAFYSGAVKTDPGDSRAKEILGHCLVIKGKALLRETRYAEAGDVLDRARRIFPENGKISALSLLAELEEYAPTPSKPISPETLDASGETGAVFECLFGDGPCAKGGNYAVHIVRKGETMAEIAIRYYDDYRLWEKIWGANPHLSNPHRLEKGMRLLIPLGK